MANHQDHQLHIVMLPFMAQGHLIPFLSLANLIAARNPTVTISLVSTPLNIRRLRPLLPSSSPIHFQSLPFSPSDHGLPADAENSDSLPIDFLPILMQASESLLHPFDSLISDLLRTNPAISIVSDVFFSWSIAIARRYGLFHTVFSTCGGFGTAAYMSLWLHLPHRNSANVDKDEFGVPGFPDSFRLRRNQLSHYMKLADGSDRWSTFLRKQIKLSFDSDAMLCNTVEEVEPTGTEMLRRLSGLKVWSVGPLVPLDEKVSYPRAGKTLGIDLQTCLQWLQDKPAASVVYISFGSQNSIKQTQMAALAAGLEASGHYFIWVLRPPFGHDVNEEFKDEWLPDGFRRRMEETGKGLLVNKWAPQLEILSHESTAAFLSHCGWNSTIESLSRGVPVIGWPLASEQFYNAKMMEEELGVCMEVARGVQEEVTAEAVEKVVRMVVKEKKGRTMRERAARCKEMIREAMKEEEVEGGVMVKGSSLMAIDEFIETAIAKFHPPPPRVAAAVTAV